MKTAVRPDGIPSSNFFRRIDPRKPMIAWELHDFDPKTPG
jgi:hypothetical protein